MGGLGLADINIILKVKRVRWIIRALKDDSGQAWSKLIENYLRCLDNQFGIQFFTLKVDDSSNIHKYSQIPTFYKECIEYFQELCRKSKCKDGMDEIIWCNDKYRFNGNILSFPHWSKSGIRYKRHLYQEGCIDEQHIFEKLRYKAGFIFEMKTVRSVFPHHAEQRSIVDHSLEDDNKCSILQYHFSVPGVGIKQLQDLSSRDIYNIFLLSQGLDLKSKDYWAKKFTVEEHDWKTWFAQNLTNKMLPRKVKDYNWKLFHGLINTESRLKRMKLSDGICKICNDQVSEDINHLLLECNGSKNLWNILEEVIMNSFNFVINIQFKEVISGYWNPNNFHSTSETNLINVLLSICRYHIWKIRNCIKYGNETVSFVQSVKRLKFDLINHANLLLSSSSTSLDLHQKVSCILDQVNSVKV